MKTKSLKQRVSILMLIIMLVNMIPVEVFAIDDGFVFENSSKTVLKKYEGSRKNITIPDSVKIIERNAFKDKGITNIKLNEGLERIDEEAFSNNKITGDIIFPSSLKFIGQGAFSDNQIEGLDFSKTKNLQIEESAFQDNKISGKLDLSNLNIISKRVFWNNDIENLILSKDLIEIGNEAFANNKLTNVSIPDKTTVGDDIFSGNGRYVVLKSDVLKSEKSEFHQYGYIVNPVDIEVRYLEEIYDNGKATGKYKSITSNKKIKFDPYSEENFFALNEQSELKPDEILNYTIDKNRHKDGIVTFTPHKDNFIVDVIYKRIPNPTIKANTKEINNLLKSKKEGDNINKSELLNLVSAYDYKNVDISQNIQVSPGSITNAEAKEYNLIYSVKDKDGRTTEYKISLPIAIDPMKIKIANTEWQLEDFIYKDNAVIDLSYKGEEKAELLSGLAIPHINPYTMEPIEIVRFGKEMNKYSKLRAYNIKKGSLVFGNADNIKEIDEFSFFNIPIDGRLPKLPNLEYINESAFGGSEISGELPELPNLKYIGNYVFANTNISGKLPEMPKLEYIGSLNFKKSKISGLPSSFPKLKYIGSWAFQEVQISTGFPKLPDIEHIGTSAFESAIIGGPMSAMPKLKYIGHNAFSGSIINSSFPEMINIEVIENDAFSNSMIGGKLSPMPKLTSIGSRAFERSEISGELPELPSLVDIGSSAFNNTDISGQLPDFPNLKNIYSHAFRNTKIAGNLPEMPKIETIDIGAFQETNIGGEMHSYPNLETIGNYAFHETNISGKLPEMPKLEHIGWNAFSRTKLSGPFPSLPNLDYIGAFAFQAIDINGSLPDLPNLTYIGDQSFQATNITGQFPNMPKLEYIGNGAFSQSKFTGKLPDFPELKHIGNSAFFQSRSIITEFPDTPKLEHIGDTAFSSVVLYGPFPKLPNLKSMGSKVFHMTGIYKYTPFYIYNNDITMPVDAFDISDNVYPGPTTLLTVDGEDAPNVPKSKFHILNPYTVNFVGKNTDGEELLNQPVIAEKSGSKISVSIPNVNGYYSDETKTFNSSELVNNTYTYLYKSHEEHLKENGGNKYQFSYKSNDSKDTFSSGEIINTKLYLSTTNENVLKRGRIELTYDENIYEKFFIPESKGIRKIEYDKGLITIYLDLDLPKGTEIGLPVSFEFKEGILPEESYPIHAALYENPKDLKGHGVVKFNTKLDDPSYKSTFSDGYKQIYKNILVEDLSTLYKTSIDVYPTVSNFFRDFKDFTISYDEVKYKTNENQTNVANILPASKTSGWKHIDNKYVYEVKDFKGEVQIPKLQLDFTRPAKTEEAILLHSTIEANVNTKLKDHQHVVLTDVNEINIFPEEKTGNVLGKNIMNPHYNGRHSFFYDNVNERNTEFKWSLKYNIRDNIDELIITDNELDSRMKYTSIDPNGNKIKVLLKDKDGKILETKIANELFKIDEALQEKVDSIDMIYYQLAPSDTHVEPNVITKLKDPNKDHFTKGNPNNVNKFYNHMSTKAIYSNGSVAKGNDFAFTDILANNLNLKTEVKITSKAENLSYGKIANTEFRLKSKELFNSSVKNMKYTALIDPAHRVEDIVLAPGILGSYDISKTTNGYTKIDVDFEDVDIKIVNDKDNKKLFTVKTTPIDKSEKELKAHGFLHSSKEYQIYNQGSGSLEGLNKSKYAYDEATAKIINGEFLSIRKLIGKDDYVGSDITTKSGEKFFYRFEIDNSTTTTRENFELIDILPFEGDNNNSSYHNTLDVEAARNIKLPTGFSIKYLNQSNFIKVNENYIIDELNSSNWSNSPSTNTKAIKITGPKINAKGNLIQIDIPMKTKANLKVVDNNRINTNTFAYTHSTLGYKQALSNPVTQKAEVPVPKRDIKLTKVSVFMGKEDGIIEGVPFALLDYKGNIVSRSTSNNLGEVFFRNIPVADYTIKEISTPVGYKSNSVSVKVNAEDLNNANNIYDLGKIQNHRIDKFEYLVKNVEIIDDLRSVEFDQIKSLYSKGIQSGDFEIINKDTGTVNSFNISKRIGHSLTLSPGSYVLKQTKAPKDNGFDYKHNTLEYKFTIDKFGKIFLPKGNGTSALASIEQQNNVVYFPNTIDYKTSTANVVKRSNSGKLLSNAKFELTNVDTGVSETKITNSSGRLSFTGVKPGLYNLKEVEAPNGYIKTNQIEMFEVPINESKAFNFEFENKELKVNVNKYKVIASNIIDKKTAEDIASKTESLTGGKITIKEISDNMYEVREVWNNNRIVIDGKPLYTDSNGSIINLQNTIPVNEDSVLTVKNETKIPGHYEPVELEEYLSDYVIREDFDGTINIDIEVKPLKGSIYVSKYVIDKNDEVKIKESVNGSKYALHVDKGNGYELLEESTISNSNYTVFKDLNPLYKYKVIETFVPDGQEDSEVKEYNVELNDLNRYTATVIFRNRIPANDSFVSINKIDGTTGQKLSGVEFTIIDKHGVSQKLETDSNGEIVFEDLKYDLAPFTIRETKAKDGYAISNKDIIVTEEDLDNNTVFTVENYKSANAPETGTFGKLPFVVSSVVLIVAAYVLRKRKY